MQVGTPPEVKLDNALLDLFTSRVRMKILNVFIPNPGKMFYVREMTRKVGEEVNAVRRELERLKAIGLLSTEKRANRLYYKVNTSFMYYYDLLRMVGKSTGLGQIFVDNEESLGRIKYLVLSTGFVQQLPVGPNDIDLLVVGQVNIEQLQKLVRDHEEVLEREINYTVMTEDEFDFRKKRNDAFIRSVLSQPQVVIIGDELELNH